MSGLDPRLQAAMDAINGDIVNIGVKPLDPLVALLPRIREALNEPVTTPNEELPEIAAAKQSALLEIYNTSTDPVAQDIALRGLYGQLPREAA